MKILIVGKNSYLGKWVGEALSNEGHFVIYLSHEKNGELSSDTILFQDLNKTEHKFDAIINFAVNYGKNNESYSEMVSINALYPLQILEYAKLNNIKYFINTATSITSLINSYTLSKNQFSQWGKLCAENSSVKFINIVLEHYIGEYASDTNFVSMLLHKMSKNEEYISLTKGMQLRDFIYIEDVVNAYITIINNLPNIHDKYFEIEVGAGIPYRIREICEYIKKVLNSKTELRFGAIPYREHEIMYTCADNTQLRKWGWDTNWSFESAINRIIEKEKLK